MRAVIIQVCFPYVTSNKNKCQKSNYFPWKKRGWGGCKVSYSQVIPRGASCKGCCGCPSSWQGLAGAEERTEQGKAEAAGSRADRGKGEGASAANETARFCLKESKRFLLALWCFNSLPGGTTASSVAGAVTPSPFTGVAPLHPRLWELSRHICKKVSH